MSGPRTGKGPDRRPLPIESVDDVEYWEAVRHRQLRLPRCQSCGRLEYPPAPACPHCAGTNLVWEGVGGEGTRGTLHSFTICYRSFLEFAEAVPYVLALVELYDTPDVRMVGNLIEADPDPGALVIGAAVRLAWIDYESGLTLPQWELVPPDDPLGGDIGRSSP